MLVQTNSTSFLIRYVEISQFLKKLHTPTHIKYEMEKKKIRKITSNSRKTKAKFGHNMMACIAFVYQLKEKRQGLFRYILQENKNERITKIT